MLACVAPLAEQFPRMIREFKVLMAVITAWVPGNQLLLLIDTEPVRVGLEGYGLSGVVAGTE